MASSKCSGLEFIKTIKQHSGGHYEVDPIVLFLSFNETFSYHGDITATSCVILIFDSQRKLTKSILTPFYCVQYEIVQQEKKEFLL